MSLRLFVSAGETSGDRHAAAVVRELKRRAGPVEVLGLGGDELAAEGAELLARVEDLSVLGFAEVLQRLPYFRRLMHRATEALERFRPHAVIPVDYPGFNLRLARRARARGFRVIYYIAPQVWAWRRERRPGIGRAVDHLLVVFPFEEPLFREAGIDARFVGHPLLDEERELASPQAVRSRLAVPEDAPLLALLPGSRSQEVRRILPPLAAGAAALAGEGVRVAVSRAPGVPESHYRPALEAGMPLWPGAGPALARAADAALVASGTATLETGLQGTPLAVVYRTAPLNWHLARALVRIRTVGLVNIAGGGSRVPELLQDALTPAAVAATARRLLFDPAERREQKAFLAPLRERLGGGGAASRAAEEILRILGVEAAP